MPLRSVPIRRKLMTMLLVTSGIVLLVTCTAFLAYEFLTFRQAAIRQLSTLGEVIASNSTAALAFANPDDARETLNALRAEPHVVAATLYDEAGQPFARYPDGPGAASAPKTPAVAPAAYGYRFEGAYLVGVEPVVQGKDRRLGTLYLMTDLGALYDRLKLYGTIAALVIALSLGVAYFLSRRLQGQISLPILRLADVAHAISDRRDYSVRAPALGGADELSHLTGAFNQMLAQIETQNEKLHRQVARHDLLNRITRAIGERQDLPSIFQVVVRSLEDNLPIDFGCVCLYDSTRETLTVAGVGLKGLALAEALEMGDRQQFPIDTNGLSRCVQGHLVYEPDVSRIAFPFPQRLAREGLRSLAAAPLLLERHVFGVLIAARREPDSFSSLDCEFLRQLSEHVALAVHQTQIHTALQQAYDDLRQSQQTVLQQERLRALGQMASGIAHDINNAISPVALYTQSLLEHETNLSPQARDYLETIDRAIDDVAATVARMREFYRQREPQLELAPANANALAQQVIDLTRARWSDMALQRGVVVQTRFDLQPNLPSIMVAEGEIRDALTNLVFNAVDAMPQGGTLTVRTHLDQADGAAGSVVIEVSDTGLGMSEETQRRCLEPFFTTKGERGTGLGLAMVYGTVQRHSAEIEIDSELGEGTTFRLRFPVPVVIAPVAPIPSAIIKVSPIQILVVDDDPLLLKSLRDTLEADGHTIVTAHGGREGVEAFQSALARAEPFDVVITDLGMPYMDGRQVATAIKQLSPKTPVIMLTGWGQRLLAEDDIPPNVDRLLSKPPKLRELRETLAQVRSPISA